MDEKRLEFRGGRAMALVPFVLFIVVTISLSFANFQDIDAMVTAGVIALLIGMIFCKSRGTITAGVAGMFNVSILLMLVVAMGQILIASGCMETVVDWLNNSVIKSERDAEISMFCLSTAFGILIAAINTIANICVSPFINAIGKNNDIYPYRRANILATTICSFPFFLPYGGCVLLLLGGINGQKDVYSFLPSLSAAQIIPTAFYCWAVWAVMLISCLTGRAPAWLAESATSRAAASGRWNMCSTTWPPRSPA